MSEDVRAYYAGFAEREWGRVEGLIPGVIGAAVPIGMSEQGFAELLASAPYPVHQTTDEKLEEL